MTIYDIAREAGVSISTVSRVMNNSSLVSPKTAKIVQDVLKRNNYHPNAMARGLATNASKSIGILMSDISNYHFAVSAHTLEPLFFNWGYSTLLCNTGSALSKKLDYMRILAEKKIDGLVLLGSVFNGEEIEHVIANYFPDTPIITSNLHFALDNCYSVQIDHHAGMKMSVDYLVSKGYEDIYFVKANNSMNTTRKIEGFHIATESVFSDSYAASHVLECEHGPTGGQAFADSVFRGISKRTAFIFMDDITATGAVNRFFKLGVDIPGQVGIIGHDNSLYCDCSPIGLTTVDTRIIPLAEKMADVLHQLFIGEYPEHNITLLPDLVIRETA